MNPFALKMGGIIVAAIALLAMVAAWNGKTKRIDTLERAVADAVDEPYLKDGDVLDAIEALGKDRTKLKQLLTEIEGEAALGQARQDGAKASLEAAEARASAYRGVVARLEASAAAGGAPCEPSAALKEAWE